MEESTVPLVMRGLDPRINLHKTLSKRMDCRVKPGNDDLGVLPCKLKL
jgi:hypothetical protein